jgi:hypothetical protein
MCIEVENGRCCIAIFLGFEIEEVVVWGVVAVEVRVHGRKVSA